MSKETIIALHAEHQGRWKNREEIAEQMIALIGQLYREKNIVVSVFGRSLVNRSVIQILKAHRFTRMMDVELSVVHTFPILEALAKIENIGTAEIDLGKLAVAFKEQGGDVDAFVAAAVKSVEGRATSVEGRDVVLYGFGRIGRILARLMIGQSGLGRGLNLKAIVVRKSSDGDLEKRASLLRRDSIHGPFSGTISVDEENEAIIANGQFIKVIYASSPSEVDYTAYGIENALLIDNTGKWRDAEGLSQHLKCAGIARVVLTAPSKGEMKNVVFGVNNTDILDEDKIISAASCTTNAITPVLKVLDDKYKVLNGHVETVHSFTNDQNLIDNYHKADRRGRAGGDPVAQHRAGALAAARRSGPVDWPGCLPQCAVAADRPGAAWRLPSGPGLGTVFDAGAGRQRLAGGVPDVERRFGELGGVRGRCAAAGRPDGRDRGGGGAAVLCRADALGFKTSAIRPKMNPSCLLPLNSPRRRRWRISPRW